MAFGGSSSSFTLPHTHNNALSNDGGALSQTLTFMGADVLYSLITDNTAQVNTNTANIATNTADIATNTADIAAIATPAWSRIVNQSQAGGSAQFNVTGLTSTSKYLMFTFAGKFGGGDKLFLRFGTGGSIDTGSNYSYRTGRNGTYSGSGSSTAIELMTATSGGNNDFFVSGFMQLNAPSDGSGTADYRLGNLTIAQNDTTPDNYQTSFQWNQSATPITDIRFYANGGNDISGTLCVYESQD